MQTEREYLKSVGVVNGMSVRVSPRWQGSKRTRQPVYDQDGNVWTRPRRDSGIATRRNVALATRATKDRDLMASMGSVHVDGDDN